MSEDLTATTSAPATSQLTELAFLDRRDSCGVSRRRVAGSVWAWQEQSLPRQLYCQFAA